MHTHAHTNAHTRAHTHSHTHAYTHARTHTHMRIHVHTHTYAHVHTHTRAHTHTEEMYENTNPTPVFMHMSPTGSIPALSPVRQDRGEGREEYPVRQDRGVGREEDPVRQDRGEDPVRQDRGEGREEERENEQGEAKKEAGGEREVGVMDTLLQQAIMLCEVVEEYQSTDTGKLELKVFNEGECCLFGFHLPSKIKILSQCFRILNPLPTIGSSLKKQKSLYKVLTPSIKPPI